MTITATELQKLGELAYLDSNDARSPALIDDINAIMDFVEQLKAVDTRNVEPLFHPIEQQQPLRDDIITESDCRDALHALSASFDDGLYCVPQVINEDNE